jgi:hypothetical protein
LQPVEQGAEQHAGAGQYQDSDKRLVGLESGGGHGNHVADASPGGDEFGHDHPNQAAADA